MIETHKEVRGSGSGRVLASGSNPDFVIIRGNERGGRVGFPVWVQILIFELEGGVREEDKDEARERERGYLHQRRK